MRIRTPDEMQQFLDDEFAWRLKELSGLRAHVNLDCGMSRDSKLRVAVTMLYAHWEGFVQQAADAYVSYVACRRMRHREVNDGFLSLALRSRLRGFTESDSAASSVEFAKFITGGLESRIRLPKLGIIKTGANLNSSRLKAITVILGLDYRPFELKEKLIDRQLLEWRNSIAHGREFCPTGAEFGRLYDEVLPMIRCFKDEVLNAVIEGAYRRGD